MGVNGVTGDYSRGAAGYWIDMGEIAWPVSELTVAGKPAGLLGQVSTASVQDAYRQVVPLVAHVIVQPTVAADGKQYYQAISSETLKPVTDWLTEKLPANYTPSQPSATTSPTSTPSPKSNKGTKSKATTGTAARPSRS